MDMMMKNVNLAQLNTKITIVVLNIKTLKIIQQNTSTFVEMQIKKKTFDEN